MRRVRERCNHAPYLLPLRTCSKVSGSNFISSPRKGDSKETFFCKTERGDASVTSFPNFINKQLVDPGCINQSPTRCDPYTGLDFPLEQVPKERKSSLGSSRVERSPSEQVPKEISLQTHDFDRQWWEVLEQIQQHPAYEEAVWMTCELESDTLNIEQLNHLLEFRRKLKEIQPQSAIFFDMIRDGQNNQDIDNKVDALVLLVFLSLVCSDELIPLLAEQLVDVANGSCPQGRTTRLAQVCMSLIGY